MTTYSTAQKHKTASLPARLRIMLKTFLGAWWVTRCLHTYMLRGEKLREELGNTSHRGIITDPIRIHEFNTFMYYLRYTKTFHKFMYSITKWTKNETLMFSDVVQMLREAEKREFVKIEGDRISLGRLGSRVYVWYYPLVVASTHTVAGTNLKSVILVLVGLWLVKMLSAVSPVLHGIIERVL